VEDAHPLPRFRRCRLGDRRRLAVCQRPDYLWAVTFFGDTNAADWRRPSSIALILANLIPVVGVLQFGWEVFPLVFLFWTENVIIGAINVLKMLAANPKSPIAWGAKIFFIPFFCVHYGIFTLVHGVFVLVLFGGGMQGGMGFPGFDTFRRVMEQNHLGWAVLGLAVSHGFSFVTNYLGGGEYRRVSVPELMQQPYGRIIVLHITILGGGFLVAALRSPKLGLLVLVALKIALDLRAHFAERRKMALEPSPTNVVTEKVP